MDLISALKKTGKAHGGDDDDDYIGFTNDGKLRWFRKRTNEPISEVFEGSYFFDEWLPYEPEPEKCECEACREADLFEKDNMEDYGSIVMKNHLRKYHCDRK